MKIEDKKIEPGVMLANLLSQYGIVRVTVSHTGYIDEGNVDDVRYFSVDGSDLTASEGARLLDQLDIPEQDGEMTPFRWVLGDFSENYARLAGFSVSGCDRCCADVDLSIRNGKLMLDDVEIDWEPGESDYGNDDFDEDPDY
ncbi:hypothetical protein ACEUZ9_004121 [Paracoccus litorisediminis]|uniref:hypothetical protein n=1 Tax=Paracoccus litorisediminis TaxID=2006130 RepID=UPI0037315CA9